MPNQQQQQQRASSPPDQRRRSSATILKRSSVAPSASLQTDEKRKSLLDVTRDNLVRQGKTSILYRLVVCGKIADPNRKTEIASHYEKFFKQFQNDSEMITGILLILQDTYIHVIEASEKVMTAFLRELRGLLSEGSHSPDLFNVSFRHQPARNEFFTTSKLLLLSGDVPGRCFSFWASRCIELGPNAAPYYVDEMMFNDDNIEKTIAELCTNIVSIGTGTSNLNKMDLKQALEDISSKFEDVLPRNEMLKYIVSECHPLTTVEEWAAIYDSHLEVTQATEHVWPAHSS
ncbi:hypothetical protein BDR26DRAFT_850349 [Obelidium mucronatum]|nr:hypothetical protein BDR26DRAFT_850349 [Obelidium mucronatum]